MPAARFLLVQHPNGDATLHQEHPFEECNTDDAKHKQYVDLATAAALTRKKISHTCEYCEPVADERWHIRRLIAEDSPADTYDGRERRRAERDRRA